MHPPPAHVARALDLAALRLGLGGEFARAGRAAGAAGRLGVVVERAERAGSMWMCHTGFWRGVGEETTVERSSLMGRELTISRPGSEPTVSVAEGVRVRAVRSSPRSWSSGGLLEE